VLLIKFGKSGKTGLSGFDSFRTKSRKKVSHPEIFISKCELFSSINLNFQKDFIQFKLK
jgi:hypothetical protein